MFIGGTTGKLRRRPSTAAKARIDAYKCGIFASPTGMPFAPFAPRLPTTPLPHLDPRLFMAAAAHPLLMQRQALMHSPIAQSLASPPVLANPLACFQNMFASGNERLLTMYLTQQQESLRKAQAQ